MCRRKKDSTTHPPSNPHSRAHPQAGPPAAAGADHQAPPPPGPSTESPAEPTPFDDRFGYRVTEEGLKALAEYEERHGKPAFRRVPLPDTVAEALQDDAWRERRRRRRKQARGRGHRLFTVCGKWRGEHRIPDLRLTGRWLERAGFAPGRQCEVEVQAGRLTIRAVPG